jgi:hypothetical protein
VPESVRVLIDTVYEAFYAHYAADFGHTIAGFFSDEPGFYNNNFKTYDYETLPGVKGIDLPWRVDLLEQLTAESGLEYRNYLPLLWYNRGKETAEVRYAYMDLVSRLYAQHFTNQIGDWCRQHKIEYIGHILEDNSSHAHLVPSAGHYFRSLWGQNMASLDVVLWQLVPGYDEGTFTMESGEADCEFYHYGLVKMGASLGHIDP